MTATETQFKIAILDDYQKVALQMAHCSRLQSRASIEVFSDTLTDPDDLVARLRPFDVICVMRERTPLPRGIIERLPQLKLIVSTGPKNDSIATDAIEIHSEISRPFNRLRKLEIASERSVRESLPNVDISVIALSLWHVLSCCEHWS
jgi:phosphoglycerate dehydrogenase-like enzyme